MKELNEIDSLFESAFDGLILTPDASVKENIDLAIASKKKRRRFLFILFPILFGITCFAALVTFYPFSGKTLLTQNENQSRLSSGEDSSYSNSSSNTIQNQKSESPSFDQTSTKGSNGKIRVKSGMTKSTTSITGSNSPKQVKSQISNSTASSKITKTPGRQKNKAVLVLKSKPVSTNRRISSGPETKRTDLQVVKVPEKAENKIFAEQRPVALAEITPDSTITPGIQDSSLSQLAKTPALVNLAFTETPRKWSLAVLTYWEGEKKRDIGFTDQPFINNKREIAAIHASTFYGKIELNRKFGQRWEVLTGLGFRSAKIVQYGYADKIETPFEGVSSGIPNPITPPEPDTVQYKEAQSFRVNSVVLPLGFGYSLPLKYNMRIRLSAGAEFAYGQFARQSLNPVLSTPTLRSFGCSVWIRPELYYSFGKMELFGFGTFNHSIAQQLKWDFETRRNPAFGGGIGLRIQL